MTVIALVALTVALFVSCYVIYSLIGIIRSQQTQMVDNLPLVTSQIGDIVTRSVSSVGGAIAESIASAFAPTPPVIGEQSSTHSSVNGTTPLAPFYATDDEDNSDPTDHDPYLGIDYALRPAHIAMDFDASDPTGLGLSQDPSTFGGSN